jgi:RNA polymerase sigma factor (TIGR02999 family)
MDDQTVRPLPAAMAKVDEEHALLALYQQLRLMAQQLMAGERPNHTLQATALVHEAVLRLQRRNDIDPRDKRRWLAAAADEMRRHLIDHARRRDAEKRGGERTHVPLDAEDLTQFTLTQTPERIVKLDRALSRLETQSPRAADVVRLRFFLGLSVDQTADGLGLSRSTVLRDWEFARAVLAAEMDDPDDRDEHEARTG